MEPVVSQTDATKGNATAQPVKFTPGPWYPQGHFVGSEGATICECFISSITPKQQAKADQTLIAAAPELLDALLNLLPDWTMEDFAHLETQPRGAIGTEISVGDILNIRAAIAKATTV